MSRGRVPEGSAQVFCWCGTYMVEATLEDIRAGLTSPCHGRDCITRDASERKPKPDVASRGTLDR